MIKIGQFFICILLINGCKGYQSNSNYFPSFFNKELHQRTDDLKKFISLTINDKKNHEQVIIAKSINLNGEIKSIKIKNGIKLYNSILVSKVNNEFPIFELKDKPLSIVIIKGKGLFGPIWAKLLINTDTKELIKLEFDHTSEYVGSGANFTNSTFENQFSNKKIVFDTNLFKLMKRQYKIKDGKHEIDAVSGATLTSYSAVQMVNEGIMIYKNYFL